MTPSEAKTVFATLMQRARTRALTSSERTKLTIARQSLRRARRPAANPRRVRNPKHAGQLTKIYGKVLRIEAQKTGKHWCDAKCKKCGHRYYHDFKSSPVMYGLTDGSIWIR